MAAGLGFKTFTTGEVLTAADTNGYLMQGILVFASAAARDAAITSPQEGQACYLKDTNQVLTYSGSAWVAVGGGSPLTTKGDVYGFSTVDARIPIGANDTVLTADSTQSLGLKWATPAAGGMTLLSTTTLSGASTTISSISGSYNNLLLYVVGVDPSTNADHFVNLNGVTNLADSIQNYSTGSTPSDTGRTASTIRFPDNYGSGNTENAYQLTISRYASATSYKPFNLFGGFNNATPARVSVTINGIFRSNTAISSIVFATNGGTFNGGTVLLYGVK